MSIWGKIIGGTLGFALGGPLGALLGVAVSHALGSSATQTAPGGARSTSPEVMQVAFTVAVIALAAKLAKADGRVTSDEVATLKRIFPIPAHAESQVGAIFKAARQDSKGFEPYAHQVATLLGNNKPVLEDLLGALLMIALADGVYHPTERKYIAEIGRIFGLDAEDVRRIESTFIVQDTTADIDPYEIIGIEATASDAEVRSAYRRLIRENHPDKLMSQGLPKEFIEVANRKAAEINTAYDRIKAERNLS